MHPAGPTITHGRIIADIETLPEAEANARLIAEAPDMHAVCRELIDRWPERVCCTDGSEHVAWDDLIARASAIVSTIEGR